MSLEACAAIVERGDAPRFLAAMSCPPGAREVLFPLYAFNVEVSRAPYVTNEPMIAEMRLQWWREAVEEIAAGKSPRAHEVAAPLADVIRAHDLSASDLDAAIAARRWDVWQEPFEDADAFSAHIAATAGHLAWASARALGASPEDERAVRDAAWAIGVARWLQAVPELEARGAKPLPDGRPEAVAELARRAAGTLASAWAKTRRGPAALALRQGWEAGALLARAARDPGRVAHGHLHLAPARRKLSLAIAAARNSW